MTLNNRRCFVSCGLLGLVIFLCEETTSSMVHHVEATPVLGWLKFWNNIQLQHVAYKILGIPDPDPVTVTTRILIFVVRNPYKLSFATLFGWAGKFKGVAELNLSTFLPPHI